jgi:hypothetical protein
MSALVTHFGMRPARLAVVGAIALAGLGFAADRAQAAYTAQVNNDTLTLTGNGASDQLALRLDAGDPTRLQVDVGDDGSANIVVDRDDFDTIVVRAGGGHDRVRIDETNGAFTDAEDTTMNGEAGNDTLLGGSFPELFRGGSENDRVDGNAGDDVGILGSDRDSFIWDPGDGSDVVEGQGGTDTLVFNGSGASENFEFLRNAGRLLFLRDVGSILMDTDKGEKVDLNALGGADNTIVNNLAGTDLDLAAIDLEGVLGGGAGDGQPDTIKVKGTNAPDNIRIRRNGGLVNVKGLPARVQIANSEAANDELTVNGRGGNDSFSVGPGLGALIQVNVNE